MTGLQLFWIVLADVFLLSMSIGAFTSFRRTRDAFDVRYCTVTGILALCSIPLFLFR